MEGVKTEIYEVIIIGGGPGGLTAGLYTSRARLSTLLIESALFGGQMSTTELIENYPGFPQGVTGDELSRLMEEQAKRFGMETVTSDLPGSFATIFGFFGSSACTSCSMPYFSRYSAM